MVGSVPTTCRARSRGLSTVLKYRYYFDTPSSGTILSSPACSRRRRECLMASLTTKRQGTCE